MPIYGQFTKTVRSLRVRHAVCSFEMKDRAGKAGIQFSCIMSSARHATTRTDGTTISQAHSPHKRCGLRRVVPVNHVGQKIVQTREFHNEESAGRGVAMKVFRRYLFLFSACLVTLAANGQGSSPPTTPLLVLGDKEVAYPFILRNGEPALLYSDLVKGPSGVFVTVWGQNIPSNATFTCGGNPCEIIIPLAFDPHHPAHGNQPARQKVVLRLSGDPGLLGIKSGGANTLPFELTRGKIWEMTPAPIGPMLDQMSEGDVLYLHAGVYNISDASFRYRHRTLIFAKRTRDRRSIIGYPGERVILDVSADLNGFDALGDVHDWTVANMECMGSPDTNNGYRGRCFSAARKGRRYNLRVVGMYNHCTRSFGEFSKSLGLDLLGNFSENTGKPTKKGHAIYHGGRGENRDVHIEYNRIRAHYGRRGIQVYGHIAGESMTNLTIRYNHIENRQGSDGILLSHSDSDPSVHPSHPNRNWIRDAVIQGNTVYGGSGSGIDILASIADVTIRNNVSYNNRRSIHIGWVKSATITNNCLDKAPRLDQTKGVSLASNQISYPDCLDK